MKFACIGEKLSHSFSAEIHGIIANYGYDLVEVPRQELESFALNCDYDGFNVTIPYKSEIIRFLDYISDEAKAIGAVNTVVKKNGKLYGYNTDFDGMKAALEFAGIDIKNKNVLILGSGGTSKTALAVCNALNAKSVCRVSRSGKEGCIGYDEAYLRKDTDTIINSTPVGMFPEIGSSPMDLTFFPKLSAVFDCVYNPIKTLFAEKAEEAKIKACGGLYMLTAQAVFASEIFSEKCKKSIDEIYSVILHEKTNLVLSGMAGCGKTVVGELAAKKLGRRFYDTDRIITEKAGRTPAEIIINDGEEAFRKAECEAITELAAVNGAVIALGGGSLLSPANVRLLKQNGKIIYIKKSPELLCTDNSRPLSSDYASACKLFSKRKEMYENTCDGFIAAENDINANVELAITEFYK